MTTKKDKVPGNTVFIDPPEVTTNPFQDLSTPLIDPNFVFLTEEQISEIGAVQGLIDSNIPEQIHTAIATSFAESGFVPSTTPILLSSDPAGNLFKQNYLLVNDLAPLYEKYHTVVGNKTLFRKKISELKAGEAKTRFTNYVTTAGLIPIPGIGTGTAILIGAAVALIHNFIESRDTTYIYNIFRDFLTELYENKNEKFSRSDGNLPFTAINIPVSTLELNSFLAQIRQGFSGSEISNAVNTLKIGEEKLSNDDILIFGFLKGEETVESKKSTGNTLIIGTTLYLIAKIVGIL